MSDPVSMLLVGATGLVGGAVIDATRAMPGVHLAALARREARIPDGARLEMLVADPAHWPDAIARAAPQVLVIALGTTIADQNGDKVAFRMVDHDLVRDVARAARSGGTRQVILVSSVGADPAARNFYLSVKGEAERALVAMNFPRIDILRPGLLRGRRYGRPRPAERLGQIVAPLLDTLLHGHMAAYRSVTARDMAAAIYALAGKASRGRYVHTSPDIHKLARPDLT